MPKKFIYFFFLVKKGSILDSEDFFTPDGDKLGHKLESIHMGWILEWKKKCPKMSWNSLKFPKSLLPFFDEFFILA